MSKVVAVENLTLDGVMQAPGRADEDTRGGFEHGGWAAPYSDEVMARKMGEGMAGTGALLFGRRTYEDFSGFFPRHPENPFTEVLTRSRKYVASRSLSGPLSSYPFTRSRSARGGGSSRAAARQPGSSSPRPSRRRPA